MLTRSSVPCPAVPRRFAPCPCHPSDRLQPRSMVGNPKPLTNTPLITLLGLQSVRLEGQLPLKECITEGPRGADPFEDRHPPSHTGDRSLQCQQEKEHEPQH